MASMEKFLKQPRSPKLSTSEDWSALVSDLVLYSWTIIDAQANLSRTFGNHTQPIFDCNQMSSAVYTTVSNGFQSIPHASRAREAVLWTTLTLSTNSIKILNFPQAHSEHGDLIPSDLIKAGPIDKLTSASPKIEQVVEETAKVFSWTARYTFVIAASVLIIRAVMVSLVRGGLSLATRGRLIIIAGLALVFALVLGFVVEWSISSPMVLPVIAILYAVMIGILKLMREKWIRVIDTKIRDLIGKIL